MKKYNEGYALPFVLVVLVVMCIIAVGIMDFSLRNLESQQNTIQRMEAKYEAAGKIEEIIAAVENNKAKFFEETTSFRFRIDNEKYLCVASASSEDSNVWIVAKISTLDSSGGIVQVFGETEGSSGITVSGRQIQKTQILEYKLVDRETAWDYVQYTPDEEDLRGQ